MLRKTDKGYIIDVDNIETVPVRLHKRKLQEILSAFAEGIQTERACSITLRAKNGKVIVVTGYEGTYIVQDLQGAKEVSIQRVECDIDELAADLVAALEADSSFEMDKRTNELLETLKELVD